jgi:hypothetical protein
MFAGSVTIGAGAVGATGFGAPSLFLTTGAGASRFSSFELQLEIPKAANNERTRTVKAIRAGVHSGLFTVLVFDFFISDLLKNPDSETTITENEQITNYCWEVHQMLEPGAQINALHYNELGFLRKAE